MAISYLYHHNTKLGMFEVSGCAALLLVWSDLNA